jgi:hypothetical protein
MDCFAEPVIGRRFAPTRWLAMTAEVGFRLDKLPARQKVRALMAWDLLKCYAGGGNQI